MARRAKKQADDSTETPASSGHNGFASAQLHSLVARIERLEEEKATLTADISEVYKEAKGHGFDTKILRQVIRLRKMDTYERKEMEAVLDLYKSALGMLSDTPLGEAALERISNEVRGREPVDA